MKIEHIKKEMQGEHHQLRCLLDAVRRLAKKVATGEAALMPVLRSGAQLLAQTLIDHMESEEHHLAALSRGSSPHWAQHLAEFKQQHLHQRSLLSHFLERVESIHASKRLGEVVQAMVVAIRLDMEHEERALFTSESSYAHAQSA
ncbi:MAG TPA: hypothetical protein VF815_30460 [Myxococcaceae bacterium]|jgi:hypothetical protein